MSGTFGVAAFVVSLILVIVIHEAAHFGVAKWFGIKVEEFFVGFGPRLWSVRRGETEYGLKAILLGGYVKIAGMNPFQPPEPEDIPRTYGAKPRWQRALVVVAGPATHFVVAFVLFALWLSLVGQPNRAIGVAGVDRELVNGKPSPALEAGVRPGDEIVAIEGTPIYGTTAADQVAFSRIVDRNVGREINVTVLRDGELTGIRITPALDEIDGRKRGRLGVTIGVGSIVSRDREGVAGSVTGSLQLIGASVEQTGRAVTRVFGPEGLGRMFRSVFGEGERQFDDAVSLVGAARAAGQISSSGGMGDVLVLLGGINIFIGLLNLIPLPPFDGGHIAVLAWERIRGRQVDARRLVPVAAAVLSFFVVFTAMALYLDIVKPIELFP